MHTYKIHFIQQKLNKKYKTLKMQSIGIGKYGTKQKNSNNETKIDQIQRNRWYTIGYVKIRKQRENRITEQHS